MDHNNILWDSYKELIRKVVPSICPLRWSKFLNILLLSRRASQMALEVKHLPANKGDVREVGLILGSGRFPGGGNGNSLQYFCLENPMDKGPWQTAVHRPTQSRNITEVLNMHAVKDPAELFSKCLSSIKKSIFKRT